MFSVLQFRTRKKKKKTKKRCLKATSLAVFEATSKTLVLIHLEFKTYAKLCFSMPYLHVFPFMFYLFIYF